MSGAIPPFHQYVFMALCLVKPRDNFTFYLALFKHLCNVVVCLPVCTEN
jgi:hypothetical protein